MHESDCTVKRDNFRLGRAMTDTLLSFGIRNGWQERSRRANLYRHARRTSLRLGAAGEVSIRENVDLSSLLICMIPSPLSDGQSSIDVGQQPQVRLFVFDLPGLQVCCEGYHGAKKISTSETGSIKDLHQDTRSHRGIPPGNGGILG